MEQKPLIIDGNNAKKLFPKSSDEWKAILIENFGKDFFNEKITDRVKTFEDACLVIGIDPADVCHEADEPDDVAYKKLKVIARALNEGWEPDYNNSNQRKWFPWFYMDKPGFRLHGCDYAYSITPVGARLVFKSEELARYAANQFLVLYSNYYE
ncbi:hypothetical protein FAM09_24705 [Niastella caeni]|uniref:Uncharacterized protein n=1 Tax=Niastella caeni TaxID=2569763 RepID=A0A4S8HMP7_9BACT|nr:hypothetical protein [Niastella caeni]THU34222.1 hypothetical protein FAM09_24705 [Niastella caeni]